MKLSQRASLVFACLPPTRHASLYLYACETDKQKTGGEDAAQDKQRKLQTGENEEKGGAEQRRRAGDKPGKW